MDSQNTATGSNIFGNYHALHIGGRDGELHAPESGTSVEEIRGLLRRLEVGDRVVYTTPSKQTVEPVVVTEITHQSEKGRERVEVTVEGPMGGKYRLVNDTDAERPHARYTPKDDSGGSRGRISAIALVAGSTNE